MNTTAKALSLMLLLAAMPGLGQEPAQDEQEETAPASETAVQETPETEAAEPAASSDSSPFDYRASEQISEDLSVSFPVDI